jgi:hypothetical protein
LTSLDRQGGPAPGRSRWSELSRNEAARATQALGRLAALATSQRLAIAHLASADLVELVRQESELEDELGSIFEQAGTDGGDPATDAERAALAALGAQVRRACQQNLALLSQARRSVSLLLGIDEDRSAYDRRARRLTTPSLTQARVRAL